MTIPFRFLLILSAFTGVLPLHAQKILTLNKPWPVYRIRYYENQQISFKLKGENIIHTGLIMQLTDSNFLLNDLYPVPIKDITMVIDYDKGYWFRFLHKVTLTAGLFFAAIGTVNIIFAKETPPADGIARMYITSAALVGSSFIFKHFSVRKYRINKNRYLKVLDVTIQ
jgi:hypothetical protein